MNAVRAELQKVATVRAQWVTALLAAVAIPVTSLLVVATGRLGGSETATSGAATGSVVGLLAFGSWAAVVAASEYTANTIVVSLATVPRRSRLYGSKLTATAAMTGAGAVASAVLALLAVLAAQAPGAHALGDPAALTSVVAAVVAVAVVGAVAGMLTRSPSASIVIVAVAVLAPKAAGGLLGGLQRWVVGASPGTVITQVVGGSQLPVDQTYPGGEWAAVATMLLVAATVAAAGAVVFTRRDG